MRRALLTAGFSITLVLAPLHLTPAGAATVDLMWDRNPEPDITGYRLYYGTASQTYTQQLDVGNSTSATVSNLATGTIYYFVAKAYNSIGTESPPSNEVIATTSTPPPIPTPTPTPTPTPSPTPTPTPTATPTPTVTPTPSASPAPTHSPTPVATPTPTPTPVPTVTPTPVPSASPTPTPAPSCTSATFNFKGNSPRYGTPGNIRTFTESGVTVKVSAFSRKYSNGEWSTSWLGFSSQGLGSTSLSEGNGSNNQYVVDSLGDSSDYVLFEFSTSIIPDQVFLNYIYSGRSDISVWIGNKPNPITNHNTLSDAFLASLNVQEENNTTSNAPSRWANINAPQNSGNVVVIAPNANDPAHNDAFKIHKLIFCRGGAPTPNPTVTPTPVPGPGNPNGLANVSTRLLVQTGNNVMIGGFIITGDAPKDVILRALGPSLAAVGVSGAIADPVLRLYDSTGAMIAWNDNWQTDQREIIEDTGLASTDDRESALVMTLPPGSYTAAVSDELDDPGIALFDLFDLDASNSQLVNLSTRGKVESQDRVMIGGFIIGGDEPIQVILRAIGPSLTPLGIADTLVDPTLELYDGNGALISQNDNWRSDDEAEIIASALAPNDDRESAIIATLAPGAYTGVVRGAGDSSGIALFEIYRLTP